MNIHEKDLSRIMYTTNIAIGLIAFCCMYLLTILVNFIFGDILRIDLIELYDIRFFMNGGCILFTLRIIEFNLSKQPFSYYLLRVFRLIKPYNKEQIETLYLDASIDLDFIINTIIPLSIYKNNENIHNHITVDKILNMRRAFDEATKPFII